MMTANAYTADVARIGLRNRRRWLDEIAPPSVPDDEQGVDDKRTARDIVQKPEGGPSRWA